MLIRFLIPLNFEPYTVNAIRYSMLLAQRFETEITLLHAYTPLYDSDIEESNVDDFKINSHQRALEQLNKLQKASLSIPELKNLRIKSKVIDGYPEDVIPAFCEEYSPDLVIMGTCSKGETIKELLGSVTLDVIKKVQYPVLAVPKDYVLNINKLNNVFFLTDFSKGQYTSLHKLVRLLMSFDTVIHNVQYCAGGKEKADDVLLNEYLDYCNSTYRNQLMMCEYIYGENILSASKAYIEENNIDLLAITRQKRNLISKILHPSLTKTMLFNVEIPMLFFHQ